MFKECLETGSEKQEAAMVEVENGLEEKQETRNKQETITVKVESAPERSRKRETGRKQPLNGWPSVSSTLWLGMESV